MARVDINAPKETLGRDEIADAMHTPVATILTSPTQNQIQDVFVNLAQDLV